VGVMAAAGRLRQALLALLLGAAVGLAAAQQRVDVPSLEQRGTAPLMLTGFWFGAPATDSAAPTRRPAVLLLHGCGGPYGRGQHLSQRMRDYAALLNAEGLHALVLDSLTPRGERELCTQRTGERLITQANRRLDALGALQWMAAQPEVDGARLALLGWSNGGSTVLSASNPGHAEVRNASVRPRAAVAFYPGCEAELERGWQPPWNVLLLVGERDDWTPAEPCVTLARRAVERARIEVYPGAFHGFDSTAAVRHRPEVPNGVRPGQGVTVGGEPAARAASQLALLQFLRAQLVGSTP